MDSQNINYTSIFFDNKDMIKTIYVNNNTQDNNKPKNSTNEIQNSIVDDNFMNSIINISEMNDKCILKDSSHKRIEEDKNNNIDLPYNPSKMLTIFSFIFLNSNNFLSFLNLIT